MSTNALAMPFPQSAEEEAGSSFTSAVLICLLLLALPVKNSAYLLPPAFIALQWLYGNHAFVSRALLLACLAVSLSTISLMLDSVYGQTVSHNGLLFGILTYATLAVFLAMRSNFKISPAQRRQLTFAVSWFVILQSVIGLMQFAVSRNSDAVCGTLGLLDFRGGITISQVYLTFNLFAMVMFLLTDASGILPKVAIAVALFACLLAHSGHQTIFLIAALAMVGLLQFRARDLIKVAALLVVFVGLTAMISSVYLDDLKEWREKVVLENSPKMMAVEAAGEVLSSPKNVLLGTGMGQFGSRAALISSGEYLNVPLPGFLVGEAEYYHTYIRPAVAEHEEFGEGSAISQPFCSTLNFIVEFGLPLTLLLLGAIVAQFYRNWRLTASPDRRTRAVGFWANVGIVFLFLCCFIENYLEFPQAIFLPALLYVAALASIHGNEKDGYKLASGGSFAAKGRAT